MFIKVLGVHGACGRPVPRLAARENEAGHDPANKVQGASDQVSCLDLAQKMRVVDKLNQIKVSYLFK